MHNSRVKKGELQKAVKSWMDANSTSDRNGQTKLHTVELVNQPSIQATAVVFSEQGTDNCYAAEMSEQVHEISLTINGLNANANVLRSIDVTVGSLFGIVRTGTLNCMFPHLQSMGASSKLTSQQVIVNAC